jgi:Tfp pilus assembly protein PilF
VLLDRALDSLQAGDVELADRNARGVLAGSATALEKAGAHVILGKIFVLRSQAHDAASEFSAAIELDPANEAATAALARLRRRGQL